MSARGEVDENREGRHIARDDERHEIGHQFLRALDGEGGDDQRAALSRSGLHFLEQQRAARVVRERGALGVSVGGFADDVIEAAGPVRIVLQQLAVGPEIAGKQKARHSTLAFSLDLDGGRAEQMARVPEAHAHALGRLRPALERDCAELRQAGLRILARVDGLDFPVVSAPVALRAFNCSTSLSWMRAESGSMISHRSCVAAVACMGP